jgi:hypothetical protein
MLYCVSRLSSVLCVRYTVSLDCLLSCLYDYLDSQNNKEMILKSQRCQWDHKEKLKTVSARISASLHSKQYNVLSRWGEHFLWFDFFSIMASEVFIFHNKVQDQEYSLLYNNTTLSYLESEVSPK